VTILTLLDLLLYLYAGVIVHVNLSPGKHRLGGSALAQCYNQLGDCAPDLDDPSLLVKAFNITQSLIQGRTAHVIDVFFNYN